LCAHLALPLTNPPLASHLDSRVHLVVFDRVGMVEAVRMIDDVCTEEKIFSQKFNVMCFIIDCIVDVNVIFVKLPEIIFFLEA
jgi:hypothetical protein